MHKWVVHRAATWLLQDVLLCHQSETATDSAPTRLAVSIGQQGGTDSLVRGCAMANMEA